MPPVWSRPGKRLGFSCAGRNRTFCYFLSSEGANSSTRTTSGHLLDINVTFPHIFFDRQPDVFAEGRNPSKAHAASHGSAAGCTIKKCSKLTTCSENLGGIFSLARELLIPKNRFTDKPHLPNNAALSADR